MIKVTVNDMTGSWRLLSEAQLGIVKIFFDLTPTYDKGNDRLQLKANVINEKDQTYSINE